MKTQKKRSEGHQNFKNTDARTDHPAQGPTPPW